MKATQYEQNRRAAENWWHYHWWQVLAVAVFAALALHLVYSSLTAPRCDLRVAVVTAEVCPDEMLTALAEALSPYGQDVNGDGEVTVEVVQYTVNFRAGNTGDRRTQSAGVSGLLADLRACYTQVFLTDDPDGLSLGTGALRYRDGSLPADDVYPAWNETCYRWQDCPVLAGLSLGSYDAALYGGSGDWQTECARLYIGSRGFWDGTATEHPEADEALWQALIAGAAG